MSTQKRLVWLDALKGIGILSIMRVHMLGPMEYIQSMVFIGAVAMFFIAAGFNFRYSSNPAEDIVKKAKRLLLPYFIYSLILLLLEHRMNHNTLIQLIGIVYARMQLYHNTTEGNISFLTIGNAPMWFLPCMFLSYVWIYLFYIPRRKSIEKTIVLLSFVVLSIILSLSPVMLPWSIDTSFILAFLLIIGYECRTVFLKTKMAYMILSAILWVIIFEFFGGGNISIGEYGKYGIYSIAPFVIVTLSETYTLSAILQRIEKFWIVKPFAYLGRNSLRLMCIHLVLYYRVYNILNPVVEGFVYSKYILLSSSFFVILTCNYLIQVIIDKQKTRFSVLRYL